ncbi:LysR family transcriptional regulator [Kibdelosporangium aridum]|uniref:ModE molybdate transport repressor domain-containing protein n=1 Tax=Kibdelosporangium aridum TaxID=2030 RepID=A0A1Y5XC52_KIBAR|nr:LysR family transcriptional regulator [Kibdelosporangium aridum]SMC85523.1 ModE molybdate transport repressor domain-containing protein [Kibdelosporangium aridum]
MRPLLDLDPRSLVVLHLIERTGSMSAAARELGWTHPAISQHVKRLERSAGCVLVERHGRGVRLTAAGEVLGRHAAEITASLTSARDCLPDLARGHAPRLRVAAFPTACATLLVDAITSLTGTQVDVRQAEPPEALAALADGSVDVAITFHDEPPRGATILGRDPVLVAVPRARALASQEAIAVQDFGSTTVIAGCPVCQERFVRHCARESFRPVLHHQVTDDYVLMQAMVAAGQGVAILPGLSLAAHRRPDIVVLPLAPPLYREVAVSLPAKRAIPASAQDLLNALTRLASTALHMPMGRPWSGPPHQDRTD